MINSNTVEKLKCNENEQVGYVIYCNDSNKKIPLGVVSDNYECKALSDYVPTRLKKFLNRNWR